MAIELTEQLLAQIDAYLQGKLTLIESEAFEKRLQQEPDLQEEVRLQQQLFDTLGAEKWHSIQRTKNKERLAELKSKLRSKEYQELSENIRNAETVYFNEQSSSKSFKKYYRYFAIAGMIVLFCGIYFSQLNTSYSSYYESNVDWSTLTSFAEKGELNTFSKGELAFKKEDYKTAAEQFSMVETSYELYAHSLLRLGASYDKLDENDKAIAAFQKLASVDDSYEASKGYWYEALLHLKNDDKEKAIIALKKSAELKDNFKYREAKVLLRKLE
ncbi:hypothetical protein IMCC3317_12550 [Kordia antarctica]|uniref:Tetratricopeptide repeat protein n=1 Tax=Kordia antarctica TaxID=1218801 RepID=A0A7L4ZHF9_9FLAO|nr:tetratricopeptide repeat protein [Kordia antarctica]QHI35907.1 hypothetical protein IMCC3317_12550 [Kordia antarctica]